MIATTSLPSADELRAMSPIERLKTLKSFLANSNEELRQKHLEGQKGIPNAQARAKHIDTLIETLFQLATEKKSPPKLALVANGGYGRNLLNPGSDLDLLFLLPKPALKLSKPDRAFIDRMLYPLWDLNFKVGHAVRSISECISEGKSDSHTRTTLFDSRFLIGDKKLFETFQERFRKDVIKKKLHSFLNDRKNDLATRYKEFSHTVYLQEPNVKESPGALRDFHNLLWISDALFDTRDLGELVNIGILSANARQELEKAFEFINHIRNDLHYREGNGADILTLRRQGPVADFFKYPQRTLLKRIEALMRDYYTSARYIRQHTETIFEIAELGTQLTQKNILGRSTTKKPDRQFKHFHAIDGRLFANNPNVFNEDPTQLLALFRTCQKFNLSPSPDLRKLIKAHRHLIDRSFRYNKKTVTIFRALLTHRGEVGRTLRLMHRVGILGRFIPEFGAMECLVQHEFFHRYTADEHTLRTIEQLDSLFDTTDPDKALYRDLFIKHEDPFALYLALLLHDSGRAMEVEEHIDGSAIQTDKVCRRLGIYGDHRKLVIFLVDQHLALFSTATRRDISDPDVISEFAAQMKNKHYLDSLLVFTYADANGTNEESWTSWKETLMLQLHRATRRFLEQGEAEYDATFRSELADVRERVVRRLEPQYQHLVEDHFAKMPKRYFRFRESRSIRHHLRAIGQYIERRQRRPDTPFECSVRWLERPEDGYTELIVATKDHPGLLRRIACGLAAHQINILSADVFTRPDGIALDIFRITTPDGEAVENIIQQLSFVTTLYELHRNKTYNPDDYLVLPKNYLHDSPITEFTVPVRALIRNDLDPAFTVIEIQAIDRLALLHDILSLLDLNELTILHARICTEKGAALDSFYVLDSNWNKLSPELSRKITDELTPILAIQGQ